MSVTVPIVTAVLRALPPLDAYVLKCAECHQWLGYQMGDAVWDLGGVWCIHCNQMYCEGCAAYHHYLRDSSSGLMYLQLECLPVNGVLEIIKSYICYILIEQYLISVSASTPLEINTLYMMVVMPLMMGTDINMVAWASSSLSVSVA